MIPESEVNPRPLPYFLQPEGAVVLRVVQPEEAEVDGLSLFHVPLPLITSITRPLTIFLLLPFLISTSFMTKEN